MNLILFTAHDREYAVDVAAVLEVVRPRNVTPIPEAPDFVEGVMSLRGKVVSLVSLRRKLGFKKEQPGRSNRVVVADVDGNLVGVVVDKVTDVAPVAPGHIKLPDAVLKDAKYLTGVASIKGRLVPIIDIVKLLSHRDRTEIARVHEKVEIVRKA